MAFEAVNLGHVDEVWLIPCGIIIINFFNMIFKISGERSDKKLANSKFRLEMLQILL